MSALARSQNLDVSSTDINNQHVMMSTIIHIFDRWFDSVTHMTGIVPQPDHRLG